MKQFVQLGSFLFLFLFSCNSNDKSSTSMMVPQDDLDVARNFVRSTLDGDYNKARTLILKDSASLEWLNIYERSYNERMTPGDKKAYKEASINIHELTKINDSTSVLRYSNSYFKKDTHQLMIVRINNQWLVDFKSYFGDKKDSLLMQDTIPVKKQ